MKIWDPGTVLTSKGVGAFGAFSSPNLGAKMFGADAESTEGFFVLAAPLPLCARIWLSGMEDKTDTTDGGAADTQLAAFVSGAATTGAEILLSLKSAGAFHSQPRPYRIFFFRIRAAASPGGSNNQPCS